MVNDGVSEPFGESPDRRRPQACAVPREIWPFPTREGAARREFLAKFGVFCFPKRVFIFRLASMTRQERVETEHLATREASGWGRFS